MIEEDAMDPIRRKILKTGAGAAAMAAAPQIFAQQSGQEGAARFYEKGPVRIRYEEAGSGFPLLLIAGGGLDSVMAGLPRSPAPSTRSRSSRASTAASTRTSATPMPASLPARSRSTGRGIPMPMTISV